jgi:hypothetical protein
MHADLETLPRKDGLANLDSFGLRDGRLIRFWPKARASTAEFKVSAAPTPRWPRHSQAPLPFWRLAIGRVARVTP